MNSMISGLCSFDAISNINKSAVGNDTATLAEQLRAYLETYSVNSNYDLVDGKPNDALLIQLKAYADLKPGDFIPQSMDVTELHKIAQLNKPLINKLYSDRFPS